MLAATVPQAVNIAAGAVSSIGNILAQLTELTELSGHHLQVKVNQAFVRKGDVEVLSGDASLLRATLPDWRPRAIADTLQWMYAADTTEMMTCRAQSVARQGCRVHALLPAERLLAVSQSRQLENCQSAPYTRDNPR